MSLAALHMYFLCLAGAQLPVPPGYECHVLERQQQPPQHTGEAPASWQSTASASSITYWKHDIHPAKTDDIPRCYEWLKLSEQVKLTPTLGCVLRRQYGFSFASHAVDDQLENGLMVALF